MTKTTMAVPSKARERAKVESAPDRAGSLEHFQAKRIPAIKQYLVPLSDFAESESALDIHADQAAVIFLGCVGVLRYSTLRVVFLLPGFLLQPRFERKQFRKRRIRVRRPVA